MSFNFQSSFLAIVQRLFHFPYLVDKFITLVVGFSSFIGATVSGICLYLLFSWFLAVVSLIIFWLFTLHFDHGPCSSSLKLVRLPRCIAHIIHSRLDGSVDHLQFSIGFSCKGRSRVRHKARDHRCQE